MITFCDISSGHLYGDQYIAYWKCKLRVSELQGENSRTELSDSKKELTVSVFTKRTKTNVHVSMSGVVSVQF